MYYIKWMVNKWKCCIDGHVQGAKYTWDPSTIKCRGSLEKSPKLRWVWFGGNKYFFFLSLIVLFPFQQILSFCFILFITSLSHQHIFFTTTTPLIKNLFSFISITRPQTVCLDLSILTPLPLPRLPPLRQCVHFFRPEWCKVTQVYRFFWLIMHRLLNYSSLYHSPGAGRNTKSELAAFHFLSSSAIPALQRVFMCSSGETNHKAH